MSKQFLAVLAAIVLVFAGFIIFSGGKDDKSSGTPGKSSNGKATLTNNVQGKGKAGVTLVEYGDYQCPYCQAYYPTLKLVQAQFNEEMKFQFRNFPLVSIHPNAFAAARAAEAAGLQNKFWEMHDALYEDANWQVWTKAKDPTTHFEQYAKDLKLDTAKFKQDFASSTVNNLINADMAEGEKLKVTGTPTFFLNGKKVQIGNTTEEFQKAIKAEIDKNSANPPKPQPGQ